MVLGLGPRENGLRPAIDPLFRSASRWYGAGVVGVILSGTLDDGAAGVATIAARGGRVIVHDPEEAAYDGMPRAAIRAVHPDAVVPAAKMAAYISEWTREETPPSPPVDRDLAMETDVAELDEAALSDPDRPGTPAAITCPDCNGPLFEISNDVMRFRCRVGHAWSPDSLVAEQVEQAEGALWVAMRSLEERAELHRRLGRAADQRSHDAVSRRHQRKAREAAEAAQTIRQMVRLPIIPAEPAPGSQSY
jgi:two-component system chemotaxis response regulator CheB